MLGYRRETSPSGTFNENVNWCELFGEQYSNGKKKSKLKFIEHIIMGQAQAVYLCYLILLEEGETTFLSQAVSDMANILLYRD